MYYVEILKWLAGKTEGRSVLLKIFLSGTKMLLRKDL